MIRLTIPDDTVIAPHIHARDETVTVISGRVSHTHEVRIDEAHGTKIHAGGIVFLPANHVHSLWTKSEPTIIQVTGTGPFGVNYVNPADDPRKSRS